MTWKERRLITILGTILLIQIAAVVIVLGIRYRENRAAAEETAAPVDITSGPINDPNSPVALSYENGKASLSFLRDDNGIWYWEADREFPLDDIVILEILTETSNWSPQQTLTDAETLENSGLDKPAGTLSITSLAGETTSLLFGKTTDDGSSYYVRRNEDESTVYIITDTLFKLMAIPIYDMCILPELPELSEESIHSVTIRGAASAAEDGEESADRITIVLTALKADGTVTWRSSGANVSDDASIRALMEDLTALKITRCVDYRPSDEAASICGFDTPAAEVRIAYVEKDNTEQDLNLTIGNRLPDDSGRYVRFEEDSTIYLLTTDLLDPLMRLASEGLEG